MTNASRLPSALDELCNDIPVERRAAERKTIHDPAVAECKKKVHMVQCTLEVARSAHQSASESCNLLPPKIQILCCFSFLFVLTAKPQQRMKTMNRRKSSSCRLFLLFWFCILAEAEPFAEKGRHWIVPFARCLLIFTFDSPNLKPNKQNPFLATAGVDSVDSSSVQHHNCSLCNQKRNSNARRDDPKSDKCRLTKKSPNANEDVGVPVPDPILAPSLKNETGERVLRDRMLSSHILLTPAPRSLHKHSGSLLLWSGGSRFYNKNSLDNQFTAVREVLLRQHFRRLASSSGAEADLFQACSDYVPEHRLTLSFEAVTSATETVLDMAF